jgi:hypothetical protein
MPLPPEFNSPACILARLAYVLHLGSFFGGLAAAVGSAQRREPTALALAALLLLIALVLRHYLVRSGWYARCRDSFACMGQNDQDPRLGRLIEERSALERKRGTPGFDPWALLAVQHQIDAHERAHPSGGEERRGNPGTAGRPGAGR